MEQCLYTCITVHIELPHQIDTDLFIQALRRIIARRGNVRLIQSDTDRNFLGAENKLKRALLEMDNKKIANFLNTKVLIGLNGREIHLQPANMVVSGNNKFDLPDQFLYHY